jgi:DNA repair photolyase
MPDIPRVYEFQTSIETLRAHHWRCYVDSYRGCEFECQYCLYKGPGKYGRHVMRAPGSVEARPDFAILDIGTTTDPYQPIETQERVTRGILEAAREIGLPLFLLTRGTLVHRDVDVLRDLAAEGLVEVSFSIITPNERIASVLEPGAPPPSERLRVAEEFASLGIPVSFHVAPVIPGLDSEQELERLGARFVEAGGRHLFAAMLGGRKGFWNTFYDAMEAVAHEAHSIETFRAAYARDMDFSKGAADTCDSDQAREVLLPLRDGIAGAGGTFVSENYPYLTTGPLEGWIYRWKLPTVYDMTAWVRDQDEPVSWDDFLPWYLEFRPGLALVELVRGLWESGELFLGTYVARDDTSDELRYTSSDEVLEPASHTLVAKRIAA